MKTKKKQCRTCEQVLPVSMFYKKTSAKDGYNGRCKACEKEYKQTDAYKKTHAKRNLERYHKDKKKIQARRKELYDPVQKREYNQDYYQRNREKVLEQKKLTYERGDWYKHRFGITFDSVMELKEEQDYACAICGKPEEDNGKMLAVDHCHTSGRIRGLLCSKCNTGLGHFDDNTETMKKAIEYLQA